MQNRRLRLSIFQRFPSFLIICWENLLKTDTIALTGFKHVPVLHSSIHVEILNLYSVGVSDPIRFIMIFADCYIKRSRRCRTVDIQDKLDAIPIDEFHYLLRICTTFSGSAATKHWLVPAGPRYFQNNRNDRI